MIDWENIDNIQQAIFKVKDYLNVNQPVRASRALERIQIYLDHMKEKGNGKVD